MTAIPLYTLKNPTTPLEYIINSYNDIDGTDVFVRPRTEDGWTLDLIFNAHGFALSNNPISVLYSGSTFYYWGIKEETDPNYYIDNNLSFTFTDNDEIEWRYVKLMGFSGETPLKKTVVGRTVSLCTGGTSNDFNITIVFKRNIKLDECDLENDGGENDLVTGSTTTNMWDVLSGATPNVVSYEVLNKRWFSEKNKRYGTLKIYLNGNPIYTLKNWEEIIPTVRQSTNNIVQIIGGGTTESGGIHMGLCGVEMKEVSYYEEPLPYTDVQYQYLLMREAYDISECVEDNGCG